MSKHTLKSSKSDIPTKSLPNPKISQKNLIPPLLQEVGKLAAGVATIAGTSASGSATGNPRNKHALSPGHSLMDWIRLGNSGTDLTGVGSQAGRLSVTPKELAQHDKETDAWLAIRGKVFNITHYIPYHPGGPEEIMQGAGKDATKLFEQVHPWVNYESLLQKCYIGRLVFLEPDIDVEEYLFGSPHNTSRHRSAESRTSITDIPESQPTHKQENTNNHVVNIEKTGSTALKERNENKTTKFRELRKTGTADNIKYLKERILLPRFDWIQKTDFITIVFYTKTLSNPQVLISPPNHENVFFVYLTYEHQVFTNEIALSKSVRWPCQTKVHHETGKIEIIFRKSESRIWENYGVLKQKSQDAEKADNCRSQCRIINTKEVNHNTVLLELERLDESKLIVPLGQHVRVYGTVNGEEVSRSYTPVPRGLFTSYKPQAYATDSVCLAVKRYDNGIISRYIHGKKVGDVLEVSKGMGNFCLKNLESREIFLLLAGGTGITPMLSLLLFLIERRIRRCQKVLLVFFNQTERDILFRQEFDALSRDEERFQVMYVLSNPDIGWKGLTGYITSSILQEAIRTVLENTAYRQDDIFAMFCGPTAFTQLTEELLSEFGFENDRIHAFLG